MKVSNEAIDKLMKSQHYKYTDVDVQRCKKVYVSLPVFATGTIQKLICLMIYSI